MKKEDFLNKEFLKQFKNSLDFSDFVSQLYKKGVESMLEGELDAHLCYDKHEKNDSDNARNGYGKKTIKTEQGSAKINLPRDRKAASNYVFIAFTFVGFTCFKFIISPFKS